MWDYIPDTFERYIITNDAKIYDTYNHIELNSKVYNGGYVYVNLYIDGKYKTEAVHRLMCKTFLENLEDKPQVNHIDANKENNDLNNLEWVTAQENMTHVRENQLNPTSRMCCEMSGDEIINMYNSLSECAEKHGIIAMEVLATCKGLCNEIKGKKFRYYDINDKVYIKTKFDDKNFKYTSSKRREIICEQNNIIYKSQMEASRKLCIPQSMISNNLKGKISDIHGYTFRYHIRK